MMKTKRHYKNMLLALLLILAGLAGAIAPQTAAAAENYGIKVAGIFVTSENASNITGPGITGKVSFDPGTRTLTLDNATIEGDIYEKTSYSTLIIELKGSNTIKGFAAINMQEGSLRITPGGGGEASPSKPELSRLMQKRT